MKTSNVGEDAMQWELSYIVGENEPLLIVAVMRQPLRKSINTWKFLIEVIICLSYDLATPQLGIYLREIRTYIHAQKDLFKKCL